MEDKYLSRDGRNVRRREVYFADLPMQSYRSIQGGSRPVVITQRDKLNHNSPTTLVAIITSQLKNTDMEEHVLLPYYKWLPKKSMVEAEQRFTVSKSDLIKYMGTVGEETMKQIDRAIRISEKGSKGRKYKPYGKKKKRKR